MTAAASRVPPRASRQRMRRASSLLLGALLLLGASSLRAQGATPRDRPRDRPRVTAVVLDTIGAQLAGLELERFALLRTGRTMESADFRHVDARIVALRGLLAEVAPEAAMRAAVLERVRRALEDRLAGLIVWQRLLPITRPAAGEDVRVLEDEMRMLRDRIAALAAERH